MLSGIPDLDKWEQLFLIAVLGKGYILNNSGKSCE